LNILIKCPDPAYKFVTKIKSFKALVKITPF